MVFLPSQLSTCLPPEKPHSFGASFYLPSFRFSMQPRLPQFIFAIVTVIYHLFSCRRSFHCRELRLLPVNPGFAFLFSLGSAILCREHDQIFPELSFPVSHTLMSISFILVTIFVEPIFCCNIYSPFCSMRSKLRIERRLAINECSTLASFIGNPLEVR